MIRETEPPKPSTRLQALGERITEVAKQRQTEPHALRRLVSGELDWIVMKALEKDRRRRYETSSDLANDLLRHLASEPVKAGPPGPAYRFQKFLLRHKSGVAVTAALGTLLLAGTAVSIQEARRAARAERLQAVSRQRAEVEARKSRQVAQFLKDMLQGVGPSVARGRDTAMLREILERTTGRLDQDLKNQPEVVAELRNTIGWIYYELGDDLVAETFHRDALVLRRQLHGEQSIEVAASLHGLGHALWRQGKLTEAETAQRDALRLRRKLLGNENPDTARSLHDLALVFYSQGEWAEAETLFREALSVRKRLLRQPHRDIAHSLLLLAMTLSEQHKLAEAESLHREALDLQRKLFGNKHPDVAFSLGALGALLAKDGRSVEAESLLRESLLSQEGLQGTDHPESLFPRYCLLKLLLQQGRLTEAATLANLGDDSADAAIYNSIAWRLATCRHAPIRDGAAAVSFAETAVAATNRRDAACLETLAAAYAETRQFAKAVSTQREALALSSDGEHNAEREARLQLYQSNLPYREYPAKEVKSGSTEADDTQNEDKNSHSKLPDARSTSFPKPATTQPQQKKAL